MGTLVRVQQATIAALTTVAREQQNAAVGVGGEVSNIMESRSFGKLNRCDGAKDAWRGSTGVDERYIQTVSPVLNNAGHRARHRRWRRPRALEVSDREFDPQAVTRTAGSFMEVLRFHFTTDASFFE